MILTSTPRKPLRRLTKKRRDFMHDLSDKGPMRIVLNCSNGDCVCDIEKVAISQDVTKTQVCCSRLGPSKDGALATNLEVDLRELESIGGSDHRLDAAFAVGGRRI
jgi:hypothetical protein